MAAGGRRGRLKLAHVRLSSIAININQIHFRPLSKLKGWFLRGSGRAPRRCPIGLYRGLTFDLDLDQESQVWLGLWERETHSFIRQAAKRCQWAVDVGAGHGELCVYLLSESDAEAVFAIEPQDAAREVLLTNLRLAAPADSERIQVLSSLVGTAAKQTYATLDSLDVDRDKPGFIKIDVDGAECDVLDSGARLLSKADVCLLVETHSQELELGYIDRLDRLGYASTVIRNAWWRIFVPEERPIDHNRWLWAAKRHVPLRAAID